MCIKLEIYSGSEVSPIFWERLSYWENSQKKFKIAQKQGFRTFWRNYVISFVWKWFKIKYLQSFNILGRFWFSSSGPTFSQSVILKLSILTLVGLVSQIKLSVSVCLFVCLSVYMFHHFSRMTEYFFWNFAYGPTRHC